MQNPTDNQLAEATLQFIKRTTLTGDEALTYLACNQWLTKISQKPTAIETDTTGEEVGVG